MTMKKFVTLGGFCGLALAAASAWAQTPWRLDCPNDETQETCVQDTAHAFAQAHPGLALRTPEHLVIALDNGRKRLLADVEGRLQVIALYPTARFVTVRERFSGGFRWHLLSLHSGTLTRIDGYPVFSPGARYFFALQSWTGKATMPVIARLFAATHPVPTLQWRSVCEDDPFWGLVEPQWSSNTQLQFYQTGLPSESAPMGQSAGIVTVKRVANKWVPLGMRCHPSPRA